LIIVRFERVLAFERRNTALGVRNLKQPFKPISPKVAPLLILGAAVGYWITFSTQRGAAAIFAALPCICLLARLGSARKAFYAGLAAGIAMYVPLLWFFCSIFGWKAIFLWLIAGWPVAAFVLLLNLAHRRLGSMWALWLTPMLWTGVEYFRSEVYYLRFAWIIPGQAAAFLPGVRMEWIGVYGLGFLYVLSAAMIVGKSVPLRVVGVVAAAVTAILMYIPALPPTPPAGALHVAGVQLEFPDDQQAADALDRLATAHPEAQILVLSEYSFEGRIPQVVRDVVSRHGVYLVAGGINYVRDGFCDTAFVVGPDGRDVFEQVKSVPVQFMGDGFPAAQRRVWESPWGKIGIIVCYDVSYGRVMDDFVRQGAQGFIIPTMDLVKWGGFERRMLHGRMAPIRAAEYGIPMFGVWSSGESQLTDRDGRLIATAGYPGQGEMISGPFDLTEPGRVLPDRPLALAMTWGAGVFVLYLCLRWFLGKDLRK
jgi:apolipoprotein N-acyltransferase